MNAYAKIAKNNLHAIKEKKPLIHNITNFVVMNFTANILLALGASPVMAHAPNEVEEMVSFAGSLVLNIGTLSDEWVDSMMRAGKKASKHGIPIILDPVGSGATSLRTEASKKIINAMDLSVIRGNASEILSLADSSSQTKGVDSLHTVEDALSAGSEIASACSSVIAITGAIDSVTDGSRRLTVHHGHPLMSSVTGTGCAATATIGAFLAVDPDPLTAAATALAFYGFAGEKAARLSSLPGSFAIHFLDMLSAITPDELAAHCHIEEC